MLYSQRNEYPNLRHFTTQTYLMDIVVAILHHNIEVLVFNTYKIQIPYPTLLDQKSRLSTQPLLQV
jgi:hypothetical protein